MKYNRDLKVILVGQAKESYVLLKDKKDKSSKIIIKSLNRARDRLKVNPQLGRPIKKRLIPKEFNVRNVYILKISNFWRILYTVETDKVKILVVILFFGQHKDNNKIFGYNG